MAPKFKQSILINNEFYRDCTRCKIQKLEKEFIKTKYFSSWCRPCMNESKKSWFIQNKDKVNENKRLQRKNMSQKEKEDVRKQNRIWRLNNPEKCKNNQSLSYFRTRERYKNDPEFREFKKSYDKKRQRNYVLKSLYKITENDYQLMLKKQNNCCMICNASNYTCRNKRLNIDHCHKSGKVRALLCDNCNLAIGGLKDSPLNAYKAYKYLTWNFEYSPSLPVP